MDEERRAIDEAHRRETEKRLTALETSTTIHLGELKSIVNGLHEDLRDLKNEVTAVHSTLYGGPKEKIGLIGKMVFAQSVLMAVGGFLGHIALKRIDDKPVQKMVQQATGKRMQLFNRKTGQYEYYMEYKPKEED